MGCPVPPLGIGLLFGGFPASAVNFNGNANENPAFSFDGDAFYQCSERGGPTHSADSSAMDRRAELLRGDRGRVAPGRSARYESP